MEDVEQNELLETFKKLSLTNYEAKIYLALLLSGPLKVGTISRETHVPQSKVYEALDRLMNKQLVEFLGGRPKEFRAMPPQTALSNLLESREEEMKELKYKITNLSAILKQQKPSEEVSQGVWTARGRGSSDFMNRLSEMFDKSKEYVYVISRDFNWSSNLAKSVKTSIRRGVKVRTIAMKDIDEQSYIRAKWFNSYGVEIKVFKTKVHPRIMVADGKEVLIRLDHNPTREERFPFTSIWSQDASLVSVFDSYIKNLWKIAEPVNLDNIYSKLKLKK